VPGGHTPLPVPECHPWLASASAGAESLDCEIVNVSLTESEQLAAALRRDFPNVTASADRAWSRAPAVRVIDCVLSLHRDYDEFVVPRLEAFERRFPAVETILQLRALINSYRSPAAFANDALNYNDPSRAALLRAVVEYLVRTALVAQGPELEQLKAWAEHARPQDYLTLRIPGFALAGFQYLRMLFGANTTKPDVHISRYVAHAVGHSVSDVQALLLLEDAGRLAGLRLRDIDTTIWENTARDHHGGTV